jgi:hypothetical protein
MSAASTGLQTVHVSSSLPNQYSRHSRLDALDVCSISKVCILPPLISLASSDDEDSWSHGGGGGCLNENNLTSL